MRLSGQRKDFYVNGKREITVEYIAHLDAVAFSFEEMGIVRRRACPSGGASSTGGRRAHPSYLKTLAEYNHVLKQKNRLLRDASEAEEGSNAALLRGLRDTLEPWNAQLVEARGARSTARAPATSSDSRGRWPTIFSANR